MRIQDKNLLNTNRKNKNVENKKDDSSNEYFPRNKSFKSLTSLTKLRDYLNIVKRKIHLLSDKRDPKQRGFLDANIHTDKQNEQKVLLDFQSIKKLILTIECYLQIYSLCNDS